ncbi:transposase [uncultured Parasutterella sp.]
MRKTREPLHDFFACRRFVSLAMDSKYPDETTILHFRHLLEKKPPRQTGL